MFEREREREKERERHCRSSIIQDVLYDEDALDLRGQEVLRLCINFILRPFCLFPL